MKKKAAGSDSYKMIGLITVCVLFFLILLPIFILVILVVIAGTVVIGAPTAIISGVVQQADAIELKISESEVEKGGQHRYYNSGFEFVYFNQCDPQWKNEKYGALTIGYAGCGPSCMAMIVASFIQNNETINPKTMCDLSRNIGGYNAQYQCSNHSVVPLISEHYGLTCEGVGNDFNRVYEELQTGNKLAVVILAPSDWTSAGHFIVLRGVEDGKVIIADPASTDRSNVYWTKEDIIKRARTSAGAGGPYWIISYTASDKLQNALD